MIGMEHKKQFKRTSRSLSQETRRKISQSLKGKPKPWSHCLHISKGMEAYWGKDNNFPDDVNSSTGNDATSMSDLV